MKQLFTCIVMLCLCVSGRYTQAQTPGFSGHVVSTFTPTEFGALSVMPDGSYFNKDGKKGTNNSTVWSYDVNATVNFVASDGQGGCVIAVEKAGVLTCQGDNLPPYKAENAVRDVAIIHFNANGQKDWWYRISDYNNSFSTTFQVDVNRGLKVVNGKVYWLSHFTNSSWTRRFNGTDLPRVGYVLVRFSLNGSVDWVHHQEPITNGNQQGTPDIYQLDVNASGDVFMLAHGGTGWQMNLGNGVSQAWISDEVRVIKLNNNGVAQWAAKCDRNIIANLTLGSFSADNAGNAYLCQKSSNMTGKPFPIPNSTFFAARINADGSLGWSRIFRGTLDGVCAVNGDVFLTGTTRANQFLQTGSSDSISLSPPNTFNTNTTARFFARYDGNGNLNWHIPGKPVNSINSTDLGTQQFTRMANGKIVLAASFGKNVQFGDFTWETSDFTVWINGFLFIHPENTVRIKNSIPSEKKYELFPNPSNGNFTLKLTDNEEFTITSTEGRLIQKISNRPGSNDIHLPVPKGIYIIRSEKTGYSEKLIIQ